MVVQVLAGVVHVPGKSVHQLAELVHKVRLQGGETGDGIKTQFTDSVKTDNMQVHLPSIGISIFVQWVVELYNK
jgi:hypothetical protein